MDKYSNLRYNPHWKSTKKGAEFFKAEKESQVSGGSSGDFSLDSFYLHSDGSSENNQQEAKTQDSLSEFGPELFSFQGANVVASNEPDGPQAKRREPADGFHSRDNPGRAFPPEIQQDPPQRAKKNFVKKNKRTLGLQSEKRNSYLELHNKKQQVLQGQVGEFIYSLICMDWGLSGVKLSAVQRREADLKSVMQVATSDFQGESFSPFME